MVLQIATSKFFAKSVTVSCAGKSRADLAHDDIRTNCGKSFSEFSVFRRNDEDIMPRLDQELSQRALKTPGQPRWR